MMYVIYFPMRKYSWTLTSIICFSSSSLNNPPSVFLGEKSCNQILIPEAQTRWWELSSQRSLGLFFLSVAPSSSPSRCVSCFLLLFFSLSLFSFALSLVALSCSSLHLVVGGVRCQETREIDPEPRVKAHLKATLLFSQLHAERRRDGVEMGRKGMRREIDRW